MDLRHSLIIDKKSIKVCLIINKSCNEPFGSSCFYVSMSFISGMNMHTYSSITQYGHFYSKRYFLDFFTQRPQDYDGYNTICSKQYLHPPSLYSSVFGQ